MALTLDSLKAIHHKYDFMRTDDADKACCTYLSDKNPFNIPPSKGDQQPNPILEVHKEVSTRRIDWHARARSLYFYYMPGKPKLITSPVHEECKPKPPVICRGRTRTRCTQTRYRESSTQTRSCKPPVCGDKDTYQHLEVYQIDKLIDSITPPGEYEAKVVERYRRRQQFKKALALVPDDKIKQRAILEAMEWEEWIAREEDIQSCQTLRMEIVTLVFKQREEKMHRDSEQRILDGTERIQTRRLAQLKKINVSYARSMRRLEGEHQKLERRYRKGNVISDHCDPASDLHAPQMRFGANPNRRHFVGFKKRFDQRVEELEKKIEEEGPGEFECPFAKLRSWAKPKVRKMEVTQRFCSETNLKNLYESLKGLRVMVEAPKPVPMCLTKKTKLERNKPSQELDTPITQDESELLKGIPSPRVKTPKTEEVKPTAEVDLTQNLLLRRSKQLVVKNTVDLNGTIAEFEGVNLGKLLQFLNEELGRLKQLKKFQAIRFLARKERWRREANESGMRQKENYTREKDEELFDQCAQIHKDTASIFLESVLEEEFDYTAEQLASQKILELAKTIDNDNIKEIMVGDKNRKRFNRHIICKYIQTQLYEIAKKALAEKQAEQLHEQELKVMEEELYAAVKKALEDEYQTPESVSLVGGILDEIIDNSVTYDFDLFTPDTSDDEFYTDREINEVINKLIRVVVRYPGQPECFTDSTDYKLHLEAEREAKAILRKLIRRTITEQRWKNESVRVVEATFSETFNTIFYEFECLRASRMVKADDRLQQVIKFMYRHFDHLDKLRQREKEKRRHSESSMEPNLSPVHSVSSAYDIFDEITCKSDAGSNITNDSENTIALRRIDYVDPRMMDFYEPPLVGRRHERYDITGHVAKRWQADSANPPMISEESSVDTPSQLTRVSYDQQYEMLATSRMFLTPWSPSIYPDLAMERLNNGKRFSRSLEKELDESDSEEEINPRRRSF